MNDNQPINEEELDEVSMLKALEEENTGLTELRDVLKKIMKEVREE